MLNPGELSLGGRATFIWESGFRRKILPAGREVVRALTNTPPQYPQLTSQRLPADGIQCAGSPRRRPRISRLTSLAIMTAGYSCPNRASEVAKARAIGLTGRISP
jgi:hypothetical protein